MYKNKISNIFFQPDLNYYPSLIKNAEIVISAPTTMIIESAIFKKKTILLNHDKGVKFGNHYYTNQVEHFQGIHVLKNLDLCHNLDSLENLIKKKLQSKIIINDNLNTFLYNSATSFEKRLKSLILKILNK